MLFKDAGSAAFTIVDKRVKGQDMQAANADNTALERAFQHARSGRYITIYEIRRQLVAEGTLRGTRR
jgi:hypothetical protein